MDNVIIFGNVPFLWLSSSREPFVDDERWAFPDESLDFIVWSVGRFCWLYGSRSGFLLISKSKDVFKK